MEHKPGPSRDSRGDVTRGGSQAADKGHCVSGRERALWAGRLRESLMKRMNESIINQSMRGP